MKTTDNNDEVNEHHKGGIEKETRARVVKLIRAKTLNWIKEKKSTQVSQEGRRVFVKDFFYEHGSLSLNENKHRFKAKSKVTMAMMSMNSHSHFSSPRVILCTAERNRAQENFVRSYSKRRRVVDGKSSK